MKRQNILLIPDAFVGKASGAIVAQVLTRLLILMGHNVTIFSSDINSEKHGSSTTHNMIYRTPLISTGNWVEKKYLKEYASAINKSQANVIFLLGSITNKNLCYIDIAKQLKLKTIAMIFMQDFFCIKSYANDKNGPCTLCLDKGYSNSIKKKCIIKTPTDYLNSFNRILIRKKLACKLPNIDYVITSTNEQMDFYKRFGISPEKLIKIPLFFDDARVNSITVEMGNYFACIAQNREEKGFQFLPLILQYCPQSIKIKAIYSDKEQAQIAIKTHNFQPFIDKGSLEIISGMNWDNGLANLVAKSRGVLIPSIWPSTTEFGFLEALGFKKPVFAFDLGIHHEKIINGVNGFISPIGDFETFANHLTQVQRDNELYMSISHQAYKLYKELVSESRWIESLQSLL